MAQSPSASDKRSSIVEMLGLPERFWAPILIAAVALALSPYLAGADFGVLRIPEFGPSTVQLLRVVGPIIVLVALFLSLPLWPLRKTQGRSLQKSQVLEARQSTIPGAARAPSGVPEGPDEWDRDEPPPTVASSELVSIAVAAGRLALELAPQAGRSVRRGPAGIVTRADIETERLICDLLMRQYPSCTIVSEETRAEARPGRLTFYVDPIDGTVNYAHGVPYSAIAIAVRRDGHTVAAVVHDIFQQITYAADVGKGAIAIRVDSSSGSHTPLGVSGTRELGDSLLITGLSEDEHGETRHSARHLWKLVSMSHGVRRFGAASLDLVNVAAGRADAYWETGITGLWDVLAGALMVAEAGGTAEVLRHESSGRIGCLASNGMLHQQLQEQTTAQFGGYQLFERIRYNHVEGDIS